MIKSEYIDITALRNFFVSGYDDLFNKTYISKKYLRYGTSIGTTKTANIEPLYAAVSHIQYKLKSLKRPVLTWWYIQHIIIAFLKSGIQQEVFLNQQNFMTFVNVIKNTLTDQGNKAFSESDIITVLDILLANQNDAIFQDILKSPLYKYSISPAPTNPETIDIVKPIEIVKPDGSKEIVYPAKIQDSKMGYIGIAGIALAALFLMKNKKGRKKKR
jgi:hypothetical protein